MNPMLLGENEYNSIMQMNYLRNDLTESAIVEYLIAFIETLTPQTAATLKLLFEILYTIANKPETKMDSISLATIIAPLVLRKPVAQVEKVEKQMDQESKRKYRFSGFADDRDIEVVQLKLKLKESVESRKSDSTQIIKLKEELLFFEEKNQKLQSDLNKIKTMGKSNQSSKIDVGSSDFKLKQELDDLRRDKHNYKRKCQKQEG